MWIFGEEGEGGTERWDSEVRKMNGEEISCGVRRWLMSANPEIGVGGESKSYNSRDKDEP